MKIAKVWHFATLPGEADLKLGFALKGWRRAKKVASPLVGKRESIAFPGSHARELVNKGRGRRQWPHLLGVDRVALYRVLAG